MRPLQANTFTDVLASVAAQWSPSNDDAGPISWETSGVGPRTEGSGSAHGGSYFHVQPLPYFSVLPASSAAAMHFILQTIPCPYSLASQKGCHDWLMYPFMHPRHSGMPIAKTRSAAALEATYCTVRGGYSSSCIVQATRLNSGGFPQTDEGGFPSPVSGSPQDLLLSTPSNNFDSMFDTGAAMSGRSAAVPFTQSHLFLPFFWSSMQAGDLKPANPLHGGVSRQIWVVCWET